ncbi:MAG: tRNA 4-thiouridine(8) synthase ThiI [Turicibacter sp.]|nr:tRNA 4-thiouridine(8) synthase ThiI [Turicibacter sp.]
MKRVLLIKYGEIALRKGNRALFERQLANTINSSINDENVKVTREQGRLLAEDSRGDISLAYVEKIRRIFGVHSICVSQKLKDADMSTIKSAALDVFDAVEKDKNMTFKIMTKRSDKQYPLTSQEISAQVGEFVLQKYPDMPVSMKKADIVIWVEIRNFVYVYADIVAGVSGLPYGSTGSGILLLSGGIDSPVAGYLMAKRGVKITPVYFHSPPHTSEWAKEKVLDIVEILSNFVGHNKLYVVPFTDVQMYIYKNLPPAKMTLFFKRAMLRIAAIIAEKEAANCLITGDSIGQVASQTAQSIAAVESAAVTPSGLILPIIRPLAAMDKLQITDIAMEIGTYDISIRPYEDCCTIFIPKHPETKPNAKIIEKLESRRSELLSLYKNAAENTEPWGSAPHPARGQAPLTPFVR